MELVVKYSADFVKKKKQAALDTLEFARLMKIGDLENAINLGQILCETWLELVPPDGPPVFSGRRNYDLVCMVFLYHYYNYYFICLFLL